MRYPFTDGWNSFWHFFFGILAIKFNIVIVLFVVYQCIDMYEKNIMIDLAEFSIGYFCAYILTWSCRAVRLLSCDL